MIFITLPEKARVETVFDIKEFSGLQRLLNRHGYGIFYFGKIGVKFFKTNEVIKNREGNNIVPIHSVHHFERKDFAVFVELVKKLDDAEMKFTESIKRSLILT